MGKYVLLAMITYGAMLAGLLELRGTRSSVRQLVLLTLITWLTGVTLVHTVTSTSLDSFSIVAPLLAVLPLVAVGSLWIARGEQGWHFGRQVLRLTIGLLFAHALSNIVQYALFKTTGRLPALAFQGGLVRFGGLWDDPNSTATFSGLVLVFVTSNRVSLSARTKLVIWAASLLNLALAWSYSGWAVLLTGLIVLWLIKSELRIVLVFGVFALLALGATAFDSISQRLETMPVIGSVIREKEEGAITARLQTFREGSLQATLPDEPVEWLAGTDEPVGTEIALVGWLNAVGLIGVTLSVLWVWQSVKRVGRTRDRYWLVPLTVGLFVGSLFVPYLITFPIGPLFFLTVGLTASYHESRRPMGPEMSNDDQAVTPTVASGPIRRRA